MSLDYSTITELPGTQITELQLERAYNRYMFGAGYCKGRDVLEVACGGGQGLGLLSEEARQVVGGDCEKKNLEYAYSTYSDDEKVEITELDAHKLHFNDSSFDVVILYEAIYYLKNPQAFIDETKRVLREDGVLIICSANKNWPDFNPSPFSHTYYSVPEMKSFLMESGFSVEFFGGFPDHCDSVFSRLRSLIKRFVVKLNLMPNTMRGKELLKRVFYGTMIELPRDLRANPTQYFPPKQISGDCVDTVHTAIFAVARCR